MNSPRFRHLDDEKWQEVRRMKQGDRDMFVREKWLDFTPGFLSLIAEWDTGMDIALDQGDVFGPFVAGPNGVTLFEVMMGDPRSFPAPREIYEKYEAMLGEMGVSKGENP